MSLFLYFHFHFTGNHTPSFNQIFMHQGHFFGIIVLHQQNSYNIHFQIKKIILWYLVKHKCSAPQKNGLFFISSHLLTCTGTRDCNTGLGPITEDNHAYCFTKIFADIITILWLGARISMVWNQGLEIYWCFNKRGVSCLMPKFSLYIYLQTNVTLKLAFEDLGGLLWSSFVKSHLVQWN